MKDGVSPEEYVKNLDEDVVIGVRDLVKYFPVRRGFRDAILRTKRKYIHAVDHITFSIKKGVIFSLVGESGCGKTTTGMTLVRLYEPTSGNVFFRPDEDTLSKVYDYSKGRVKSYDGYIDIASMPDKWMKPLRTKLQIIFQDPYSSLNPAYRIKDILMEPLLIHEIGEDNEERYEMILKALEAVKLTPAEDIANRFPHMLSGGQRQRVNIARVLLMNPSFVVADEPIAMIDVSLRAEVLLSILDLKEKFGISVLFITHDLTIAYNISDYIAVMYLGKIVELGTADQIIKNPLHPYTKALVAAIPIPDPSMRNKLKDVRIKGEITSAVDIPPGCRFNPRCVAFDENPQIQPRCLNDIPELVEVEAGHYVACHLY